MGSIFYKKLKKCCFDLLFPHFIFYFFGLGYCDVTVIPRLLCLQMLCCATYSFYIPCLDFYQGTLNYRECAGTTCPYSWVCKQKSLMVNKYDKDWFLSDMYYTKLVKDPKDYPNFKFEIIFQTFQKVRANQSF